MLGITPVSGSSVGQSVIRWPDWVLPGMGTTGVEALHLGVERRVLSRMQEDARRERLIERVVADHPGVTGEPGRDLGPDLIVGALQVAHDVVRPEMLLGLGHTGVDLVHTPCSHVAVGHRSDPVGTDCPVWEPFPGEHLVHGVLVHVDQPEMRVGPGARSSAPAWSCRR